jgi:hypothetical protein
MSSKIELAFQPELLSTLLLKRYLKILINDFHLEEHSLVPEGYRFDACASSNFKVITDLTEMSVNDWKGLLMKKNKDDDDAVEALYSTDDDTIVSDSEYLYQSWLTVDMEAVEDFSKQMNFFRLVSKIVRVLSSRSLVIVSEDHVSVEE